MPGSPSNQAYEEFARLDVLMDKKNKELIAARAALLPLEREVHQLDTDWSKALAALRAEIKDAAAKSS